jgi:wobble nucleotide-excising tRNase
MKFLLIQLLINQLNFIIPPMFMQNVSSLSANSSINNRQFNLHFINIIQSNPNITISIHFEMNSLHNTLGYMLIYQFDQTPELNSSEVRKLRNFVKCFVEYICRFDI